MKLPYSSKLTTFDIIFLILSYVIVIPIILYDYFILQSASIENTIIATIILVILIYFIVIQYRILR